jgi:uncharacterized protein DUF3592
MGPPSREFDKVLGAVFALVGLGFVAAGVLDIYRGHRSHSWKSATGVIVRSFVAKGHGDDATHTPVVVYRYRVGDVEHESKRIGVGIGSMGHSEARSRVDRYKAGATVPVFYDPEAPAEAVLERGIFAKTWVSLILGTLCVAIGLFFRTVPSRWCPAA